MTIHGKRLGLNGELVDAVMGNEQLMQLAWWQERADRWPVYISAEKATLFLRCRSCNRSIMATGAYIITLSDLTAQTVAHLRQFHREIGANGREDAKVGNRDDLPGNSGSIPDPASGHEAQE